MFRIWDDASIYLFSVSVEFVPYLCSKSHFVRNPKVSLWPFTAIINHIYSVAFQYIYDVFQTCRLCICR